MHKMGGLLLTEAGDLLKLVHLRHGHLGHTLDLDDGLNLIAKWLHVFWVRRERVQGMGESLTDRRVGAQASNNTVVLTRDDVWMEAAIRARIRIMICNSSSSTAKRHLQERTARSIRRAGLPLEYLMIQDNMSSCIDESEDENGLRPCIRTGSSVSSACKTALRRSISLLSSAVTHAMLAGIDGLQDATSL
jgi:hypothetical protein